MRRDRRRSTARRAHPSRRRGSRSRLAALHAAAAEFDRLRQSPGAEWIGEVSVSLDPLARALARADAIRAVQGPLRVVHALESSEAPIALLSAIIARA
jgi:hypothetical protein